MHRLTTRKKLARICPLVNLLRNGQDVTAADERKTRRATSPALLASEMFAKNIQQLSATVANEIIKKVACAMFML